MRLTITNDDGEVFVAATNVHRENSYTDRWIATDEDGEETLVDTLLFSASLWEQANLRSAD